MTDSDHYEVVLVPSQFREEVDWFVDRLEPDRPREVGSRQSDADVENEPHE